MREKEQSLQERNSIWKEGSYSVKVEVEELEGLLGPEDVDVDFKHERSKRRKRAQDF